MPLHTHESLERHEEIKGSSNRSFGLVFVVVFFLVAIWPVLFGSASVRIWAIAVSGGLLFFSLIIPGVLSPLNRCWTQFGALLHRITNPVIMGLIFFLTVTPTALVFKALGKDPLRLKLDPEAESYWIHRDPPGPAPNSMSRQF
tara:strand:+ start:6973 stop:7404 length:432 start_codon:yes stop_codon:yes gene_type:complete